MLTFIQLLVNMYPAVENVIVACFNSQKQNGCNALRTVCFCWREPSASGATGGRLKVPKNEGEGWLLLAARGWRVFLLFLHGYRLKSKYHSHAYKNHDSPAAGGDQQASLTWAAGGLQMAEMNVAGMKRKVLSAAKPCSVMQAK